MNTCGRGRTQVKDAGDVGQVELLDGQGLDVELLAGDVGQASPEEGG